MLEYGVKQIIINPTLITKSNDIVRIVDSRSHNTRAYVLPAIFKDLVEKLSKELDYKKWVQEKKRQLKTAKSENLDDISEIGIDSMREYLS